VLAVIHIDAVAPTVFEKLLEEGRLPTLAALRARGTTVELDTPATHVAGATYATLYSGLEPGDHGSHYAFQWSAPEQRVRFRDHFGLPELIWSRLDRAGKRTLVIDPYEAHIVPLDRGITLIGWQFEHLITLHRGSVPAGERRALARALGRPPQLDETFGRPTAGRLLAMRRDLLGASDRVADAVLARLSDDTELVWAAMLATHLGGHWFWDLSQIDESALDEGTRALLTGTLAQIHVEVDTAVARILDALPEDADVIVLSPLGMGVNRSRSDLLPGMVSAVLNGSTSNHSDAWSLRARVPTGLRAAVSRTLPDRVALAIAERVQLGRMDWSRTKAFAAPSDHGGFVRLNLRGRERDGIVEPKDADALLDELAAGISSFQDFDGGPAVESVERRETLFTAGKRFEELPDLIVSWSETPATRLRGVFSPEFGEVRRHGVGSGRCGNHYGGAWAILVPGRAKVAQPPRQARLVDVPATIAELFDLGEVTRGEPLLTRA
jgi:predicted AlkP superfamily phosphohydrolase/phosphomutase